MVYQARPRTLGYFYCEVLSCSATAEVTYILLVI